MINLMQGDCLELMKSIPDGSVDLILADPPYGTTACKWDSVIPFEPMWEQLKRIIKPNGAIVLFGSEPFSSMLRCSNLKIFKYDWVWQKNRPSNISASKYQPMKYHENISVFCYGKTPYFKQMIKRSDSGKKRCKSGQDNNNIIKSYFNEGLNRTFNKKDYDYFRYDVDLKNPSTVLQFNRENNTVHPTQKPVALLEYLIKTYTQENETVLDFTMGSGSTGVAAKNLNRSFIGIELDEKYFEIARERINDH